MSRTMRRAALRAALVLALPACESEDDLAVFRATLNGANEVPSFSTSATGTAEFTLQDDGTLTYLIDVADLTGVTMGHIHGPAAADQNAGVIVWLYPEGATTPGTPTGTMNGRLADGVLSATNSATIGMDSLLVLMRGGSAYVNIHTTTRGAGEIRGQILQVAGPR